MATMVRPERPTDRGAVDIVHLASFPTSGEATLVARLRASGSLSVSLVAVVDDAIVGHVAFSPVTLEGSTARGAGLGPVAVVAAHRCRGVAAALIEGGLAACRASGFDFAVVLGDPAYYGRFGFEPAARRRLLDEYRGGDAFQALELRSGSITEAGGLVRYAAAFSELPDEPPPSAPSEPLAMILALGPRGELGHAGGLPWDVPEDRAFFARTTRGHAVIMGRRTWEERGKPLAGRRNLVVSSSPGTLEGAERFSTLGEAVEAARETGHVPFVIGGARLYAEAHGIVTRVYLTDIPSPSEAADVFFDLDRSRLREITSWSGDAGERYRILEPLAR